MKLSGSEKVAVFLISIGQEAAAEIMRQMQKNELRRVLTAMQNLRRIDQKTVDEVLLELSDRLQQPAPIGGNGQAINDLMSAAFGQQAEDMARSLGIDVFPGLPALEDINDQALSTLLRQEHPQTVALILAHLSPTRCKTMIKVFQAEQQVDVIQRIAQLESVDPETLEQINETITTYSQKQVAGGRSVGGVNKVAAMLNGLDAEQSQQLLSKLEQSDPELVAQVREQMFTFEDLVKFSPAHLAIVMKQADRKTFLLALKLASKELVTAVFTSQSQRAGEMLKEDFEAQPPAKKSDVEQAQREIATLARELMESGSIEIITPGEYVA